jgi:hypothetical protein
MTQQEHQNEHDRVDVHHRIRPIADAGLVIFVGSKNLERRFFRIKNNTLEMKIFLER